MAPAEAAVDEEKRRDLCAVVHDYRRLRGNPAARFDVASVYYDTEDKTPDITLFKNAFPMP